MGLVMDVVLVRVPVTRGRLVLFALAGLGGVGVAAARADIGSDLHLITETANSICNVIPTTGERESVQVDGNVKAELSGLLKKLTDAGLSGSGKFTSEEYVGVLQKDLASALKNNADCKETVFKILQEKILPPSYSSEDSYGWGFTPRQAEALRLRLQTIFPKSPVYIKCRTIANDCEKFAYVLYDVLLRAGWPVAPPMTTQGDNISITGERGIKVISSSSSAGQLTNALQARDVGGLPATLEAQGDDQHILINIGDRS
jgi:hypothetical protein